MRPQKNNVLEVLPEWGPEYEISLDLKVNSWSSSYHGSIFRFLASEVETGDWFRIGQRTPGLWTEKYSTKSIFYLHLATNIDSNYNQYFNRELGSLMVSFRYLSEERRGNKPWSILSEIPQIIYFS